jgi:hypothetical protein
MIIQGRGIKDLSAMEVININMLSIDVATIFLFIFVSMEIGREFQNRSIQIYASLIPNRKKYFMSKLVAYLFISVIIGLIVSLLSMGNGYLIIRIFNKPFPSIYQVMRFLFGCIFMPITYTVLAICASFFFRNTAGGIVSSLLIMFLPSFIKIFPGDIQDILISIIPASAIHSLSGIARGAEDIGIAVALLVLAMWCILGSIIAVRSFGKKDISN